MNRIINKDKIFICAAEAAEGGNMNTLEYAIQMELDGRKYYLEQAQKNQDNALSKVFNLLAESEKEHAELLRKRLNEEEYALHEDSSTSKIKTLFH